MKMFAVQKSFFIITVLGRAKGEDHQASLGYRTRHVLKKPEKKDSERAQQALSLSLTTRVKTLGLCYSPDS